MKKSFLLALFCLLTTTGFAALSPFNQSIAEIQRILESPVFQNSFPTSEMVQSIEKDPEGYIVMTSNYEMLIEVKYIPSDFIGPQPFELIFHKPIRVGRS